MKPSFSRFENHIGNVRGWKLVLVPCAAGKNIRAEVSMWEGHDIAVAGDDSPSFRVSSSLMSNPIQAYILESYFILALEIYGFKET